MTSRMTDVLEELQRLGAVSAPLALAPVPQPQPPAQGGVEIEPDAAALMETFQAPFPDTDAEVEPESPDELPETESVELEDADDDADDNSGDDGEESNPALLSLQAAFDRLALLEAMVADLRSALKDVAASLEGDS